MIEMGVSVATSLHLAATLPNLVDHGQALMSNLRIKQDILDADNFKYDGRDILVPQETVGLGVSVNEEELERRTVERFEEDLTGSVRVHGELKAVMDVGEAIEVDVKRDRSAKIDPVMAQIEARLSAKLDELARESRVWSGG